jgi:hypothetical protein
MAGGIRGGKGRGADYAEHAATIHPRGILPVRYPAYGGAIVSSRSLLI